MMFYHALDLNGVHAKLGRAQEHTNALEEDVRKWFNPDPYRLIQEFNADFTELSLVVERIAATEPRLQRWSLQFGDAIHNLRSALDHLIYAIAIHQSGRTPPPGERSLAFIIEGCHEDFARKRSRMKPNALSSIVWAAMESVQPYNRPHPVLPPLLEMLANLDNSDKHRLTNAFIATPTEIETHLEGRHPIGAKVTSPRPFSGKLADRTEILRTKFSCPAPEMKYKMNSVEIVFAVWHGKRNSSDEEWHGRNEATGLLRLIYEEVEAIIDILAARGQRSSFHRHLNKESAWEVLFGGNYG